MGFKKLIIGEKMPDRNDPLYQERYEKDVEAGRQFAKALKLDKGAGVIQHFAATHRNAFLVIIFSFVFLCTGLNIYRMTRVYSTYSTRGSAVQNQERAISERQGNTTDLTPHNTKQQ